MADWTSLFIPMIILGIILHGLVRGVKVFDVFVEGAFDGLKVAYKITPTMIAVMLGVGMLSASGGLDLLSRFFEPAVTAVGIPKEVVPLMLMRPISGSGALAIFKDILSHNDPDGFVGRVASVIQGSTETTFYTIALYYSVTKVRKTRHTLGSALAGDLTGFAASALMVTLFFYTVQ